MNTLNQTDGVSQALAVRTADPGTISFFDPTQFAHLQRLAKMFTASELVPKQFQGEQNIPNVVIALEMAQRMGAGCLAVMQSIYVVYGKPGWASTFIIACLNTSGRFEPLMFDLSGTGDNRQCIAWTVRKGVRLPPEVGTLKDAKEAGVTVFEGPACSIALAKQEGWFTKNGSKWQTMPELMLRYRAATWFGRLYAPELLMGMSAVEEIHDTIDVTPRIQVHEPPKGPEALKVSKSTSVSADGSKSSVEAELAPATPPGESTTVNVAKTPQEELRDRLEIQNGVEFEEFRTFLGKHGFDRNADSYANWGEVPTKTIDLLNEAQQVPKIIRVFGKKGVGK